MNKLLFLIYITLPSKMWCFQ